MKHFADLSLLLSGPGKRIFIPLPITLNKKYVKFILLKLFKTKLHFRKSNYYKVPCALTEVLLKFVDVYDSTSMVINMLQAGYNYNQLVFII